MRSNALFRSAIFGFAGAILLVARTYAGVSLADDRQDGRPVALLPTAWTEEAKAAVVPLPEYPRPQMTRQDWLNLNGTWEYMGGGKVPDAEHAPEAAPLFSETAQKIHVPFPPESYLSGVMRKQEINLWYRRPFTVPQAWSGKRILLHFGAVDSIATAYVNGRRVGTHTGGATAFSFDITDQLKGGTNMLVVGAWDNNDGKRAAGKNCVAQGDYTFTSGIWQTVWLEPVPENHISRLIVTPDLNRLAVKIRVEAASDMGSVCATVGDKNVLLPAVEGRPNTGFEVSVPHARRWSPEDPFLYDLKIELKDSGGKVLDEVGSYFGMRSVGLRSVAGQMRPELNGEFCLQLGPLDQGYWPDGIYTAPTDAALKFDLEVIKRLGFNMVRKHVKVEPQRWYYWADRLGLMVLQDMPCMFCPEENPAQTRAARAQFESEWKEIIDQHINSPAIVAWVPFNENWGAYDVCRIAAWTKQYDPTRLVDANTGGNEDDPRFREKAGDPGPGDFLDHHVYIGPGGPFKPDPARALAVGEYGGVGLFVPGHMWPVTDDAYGMQSSIEALTQHYERLQKSLLSLVESNGVGMAVYTQITDVEHEVNGFLTYDRKVEKMDFGRVRAANQLVRQAAERLKRADESGQKP